MKESSVRGGVDLLCMFTDSLMVAATDCNLHHTFRQAASRPHKWPPHTAEH
jgi:hypothetical protein